MEETRTASRPRCGTRSANGTVHLYIAYSERGMFGACCVGLNGGVGDLLRFAVACRRTADERDLPGEELVDALADTLRSGNVGQEQTPLLFRRRARRRRPQPHRRSPRLTQPAGPGGDSHPSRSIREGPCRQPQPAVPRGSTGSVRGWPSAGLAGIGFTPRRAHVPSAPLVPRGGLCRWSLIDFAPPTPERWRSVLFVQRGA